MAKTERARDEVGPLRKRVKKLEGALQSIVAIFADREAFVMQGPRAFMQVEQIAREALDE